MARNDQNSRRKQPARSSRTWNAAERESTTGSVTTGLLSLAGGLGLGAALMYLFDPEAGQERRQHAAERAKGAMETGGAALGTALHTGGEAASSGWESLSTKARDAAAAAYEALPSRKSMHRAHESAKASAYGWLDSAGEYLPSFGHRRRGGVSPSTASGAALGALAIGVGAMWLLDPARGRGRRAWVGQKATRFFNQTGRFLNATGRHLRNKGKGYYYETTGAVRHAGEYLTDSTIAERVRSALGRLGLPGASSVGVRCTEGRICLSGRCAADDVDRILGTTRNIAGVRGIDNEMEVGDTFAPSTSPNTGNVSA
jgi:hypothetical protein